MSGTTEQWATVEGFNGDYRVSTHGRVMSFKHDAGGRLLKPRVNSGGYLELGLCLFGVRETRRVHKLVAEAFIPNPEDRLEVNHKNGIKTDNNIGNLEWCTRSENSQHAYDMGLNVAVSGERHHMVTTSDRTVALVREIYSEGFYSTRQLAKIFGVSQSSIHYWVNKKLRAD